MSDTASLKNSGFLERSEFINAIARERCIAASLVAEWIDRPLGLVRSMLCDRQLIIQADDRVWSGLYSPELVLPFVAYYRWHKLGSRTNRRHNVAMIVKFLQDVLDGEAEAVKMLPPRLRDKYVPVNGKRSKKSSQTADRVVVPLRKRAA